MWVFTTTGFYSINRTPDGERLQLRARVREDLDKFRERYCPSLGETLEIEGTDYPFRAEVDERFLSAALVVAVTDIDYHNFKRAVEDKSLERANAYRDVWSALYRHLDPRGRGEWDDA